MPDRRANARAVIPATNATDRRPGTGLPGWPAFTRRPAHHHQPIDTTIGSVGSGSNVQPKSSVAAVGASVGTGPCAATGTASARAPTTPVVVPTTTATDRRSPPIRTIDGIVARTVVVVV